SQSVAAYVESRDYLLRREQAEYIGLLTHELRNPLTTALASAAVLSAPLAQQAQKTQGIEPLTRSLERMVELVNRVLLMEQVGAVKLDTQKRRVSLRSLVERSLNPARDEARRKGLRFEVASLPTADVDVDPELTVSVLQNVVGNAVKYTDRGSVQVVAK